MDIPGAPRAAGELYRRARGFARAVGKRREPAVAANSGVGERPSRRRRWIHIQPLFITYAITPRHDYLNGIGILPEGRVGRGESLSEWTRKEVSPRRARADEKLTRRFRVS